MLALRKGSAVCSIMGSIGGLLSLKRGDGQLQWAAERIAIRQETADVAPQHPTDPCDEEGLGRAHGAASSRNDTSSPHSAIKK